MKMEYVPWDVGQGLCCGGVWLGCDGKGRDTHKNMLFGRPQYMFIISRTFARGRYSLIVQCFSAWHTCRALVVLVCINVLLSYKIDAAAAAADDDDAVVCVEKAECCS